MMNSMQAAMAGWGTFSVEHVLFGVILGVLAVVSRTTTAPVQAG